MTLDRRIEVLRNAFPTVSDELLTYIARVAREIRVAPGDRICEEGEIGNAFYLIMSGRVQVSKFLAMGIQHLLSELNAGQFFGEMSLVEEAPREASVDALEETSLLVLTKQDFQEMLAAGPAVAMAIMRAMVARLRDTDRRTIQELGQKNDELAKAYVALRDAMQRRSDFLTVIAHELRTPLTSIKGYAHFIRLGMLKGDELTKALGVIVNNTDSIVRLINNILFLQELELIPPTFEPVDMHQLLHSLVDAIQVRASESKLTFKLSIPETLPKVNGDLDELAQAIGALLDNAVKFSPNGGTIIVSAEAYDASLHLSIADPGVGIPPDQLYHIFDRYQHLEAGGDHLFGGVGLGLPIAKQVVEQHSGTISVISRLGEGSTFTLTLPLWKGK